MKDPGERIGRYIFKGIRPLGVRVVAGTNPIPQEQRPEFKPHTLAKIEKPK